MEKDVQLGLGKGPMKSGSNVPAFRVPSVPRCARWNTYLRRMPFLSQLYSGQLRAVCNLM